MTDRQNPDSATLHHTLVDHLVEHYLITSPPVEAAFRAVRREHFLPELPPEELYQDRAIGIKDDETGRTISSSSQPAIMAIMLEQLALQPGHNVLEIGAGTGYNAALLAHIVGQEGHVTTLDLEADLVASARAHLATAGFDHVDVICGDGMRGYPANAPYDRIVLTVAGWEIPPEWLEQLKPDGRLLLPLSFYGPQLSIAFERQDGHLSSRSIKGCGFVPLRGPRAEPSYDIQIGARPDVTLTRFSEAQAHQTDPATLESWLRGPYTEQPTGFELSGGALLFEWPFWAGLHEPDHVLLRAHGEGVATELVPDLLGKDEPPPWRMSMGILGEAGLALLTAPPPAKPAESDSPFAGTYSLHIRAYGPDKAVAARLLSRLRAWDEAGRPWVEGMSVWAVPVDESPLPPAADACLTRRWHHFCIRWEDEGHREPPA